MLRAVLDANVFVSAAIRPDGPPGVIADRLLRDKAFDLVLSSDIIEETLRVLAYPKIRRLTRRPIVAEDWFSDLVLLAHLVLGETRVTGVCADPDDDKYLAAAVEGRADVVVTGDGKLLAVVEHAGVRVITPRKFLELLR